MRDRVVLITGATDGIGKQTALDLARLGATALVHGRSRSRGEAVCAQIRKATGDDRVELFVADFASMKQVRELAAQVKAQHDRLHVLINNAGVFTRERKVTEDGFEMTFAVNHLAHFLLTNLLLGLLKASAPARIINVSSAMHLGGRIDLDDLQLQKRFSGSAAYAASKLANVLFTNTLAERLKGVGITANSLHPGAVTTKMLAAAANMTGISPKEGAETSVYLASASEVETVTGKYFVRKRETQPASAARDNRLMQKLWEISEKLVGL